MERIVSDYPSLRLFSLPSVANRERRHPRIPASKANRHWSAARPWAKSVARATGVGAGLDLAPLAAHGAAATGLVDVKKPANSRAFNCLMLARNDVGWLWPLRSSR